MTGKLPFVSSYRRERGKHELVYDARMNRREFLRIGGLPALTAVAQPAAARSAGDYLGDGRIESAYESGLLAADHVLELLRSS